MSCFIPLLLLILEYALVNGLPSAEIHVVAQPHAEYLGHHVLGGNESMSTVDQTWLSNSRMAYLTGGPVLTQKVHVHYIFYGSWSEYKKQVIRDFTSGLGDSAWWKLTQKYYYQANSQASREYVSEVHLGRTVDDQYSLGHSLSGYDVPNIIMKFIKSHALPLDPGAVYFLLVSDDVDESMRPDVGQGTKFKSGYCGYHLSWQLNSNPAQRIHYAVSGYTDVGGCLPPQNSQKSPNGDVNLDALISTMAHEITETVTDPEPDVQRSWQSPDYYENADVCAWNFGTTEQTDDGAVYNHEFYGRKWLIQQVYDLDTLQCASSP